MKNTEQGDENQGPNRSRGDASGTAAPGGEAGEKADEADAPYQPERLREFQRHRERTEAERRAKAKKVRKRLAWRAGAAGGVWGVVIALATDKPALPFYAAAVLVGGGAAFLLVRRNLTASLSAALYAAVSFLCVFAGRGLGWVRYWRSNAVHAAILSVVGGLLLAWWLKHVAKATAAAASGEALDAEDEK